MRFFAKLVLLFNACFLATIPLRIYELSYKISNPDKAFTGALKVHLKVHCDIGLFGHFYQYYFCYRINFREKKIITPMVILAIWLFFLYNCITSFFIILKVNAVISNNWLFAFFLML
jgi:hypothetical protein